MRIAVIPARGGSRRIPRKNIKTFHGRPIIAYSIEAAKASGLFDEVWVSTDSAAVAKVAKEFEAKVHTRPEWYGSDHVGTNEVTAETLRAKFVSNLPDHVCCIYATAPMLGAQDLRTAYTMFERGRYAYALIPGWYYWGHSASFLQGRKCDEGGVLTMPIPDERWIDINTEEDWQRAEQMYAALHKEAA